MKIKIVEANKALIEDLLKKVNGKATTHVYTSYLEILDAAKEAERRLEAVGLPASHRAKARYTRMSGLRLANSYKYSAIVNQITLVRGIDCWFLVDVELTRRYPGDDSRHECLEISQVQKDAAFAAVCRRYRIFVKPPQS